MLDRLGQPDFEYREYGEAQASHLERWPLFELVSRQLRPNRAYGTNGLNQVGDKDGTADSANSVQSLASRISIGLGR